MVKFKLSNENQNFGKLVSITVLDCFTILTSGISYDKISGDINECNIFILHNEIYIYMGDLYYSVNQCFLNDKCIML